MTDIAHLRWLCSPGAEGLSDGYRLTALVHHGHAAADEIEQLRKFVQFIADGGDENSDYDQFVYRAQELVVQNASSSKKRIAK